jgi:hypothetical protein
VPWRVAFFDQRDLPGPLPALDAFPADDGGLGGFVRLTIDQTIDAAYGRRIALDDAFI